MAPTISYVQRGTFELPAIAVLVPDGWIEVPDPCGRSEARTRAARLLGTRATLASSHTRRLTRWILSTPRDLRLNRLRLVSAAPVGDPEVLATLLLSFGVPLPGEIDAKDPEGRIEILRNDWTGMKPAPEISGVTVMSGPALRVLQQSIARSGAPRSSLTYAIATTDPLADITVAAVVDGPGDHRRWLSDVDSIATSLTHSPGPTPDWGS